MTVDTLRADRLGAYGDVEAATPRFDALAASGVLFENASASVPLTLPSHSSLFTGRWPHALGIRTNARAVLDAGETTLAELLAAEGHSTAAFVASFVLARRFGLDQGFELYDDRLDGENPLRSFASEIPGDRVLDRFEPWLRQLDGGAPFFAWLHLYDPHQPWSPPGDLATRFADDPYRGEVAFVDRQIGRVLDLLEETGRTRETLVVVTSDHGEGFGEHGEVGHGYFAYEEHLRVPLVLAQPGALPEGLRVEPRVRLVDLLPTLSDLLDLPLPNDLDGESFAASVLGEAAGPAPGDVVFESRLGFVENGWAPVQGVIVDSWKYIAVPDPELYDLETDPGETRNLAEERRGEVRRLDDRLREMLLGQVEESDAPLDAEARRRLEALGYTSPAERRSGTLLDPKVGVAIHAELDRADAALSAGDPEAAESVLLEVRERHPDVRLPAFFSVTHAIALARDDLDGAIAALEQALAEFPDVTPLSVRLLGILEAEGRWERVAEIAGELAGRTPPEGSAFVHLARARLRLDDPAGAAAAYRSAVAADPSNAPLALEAGRALALAGRNADALDVLAGGIDTGILPVDGDPTPLYQAATLAMAEGRTPEAERFFRAVLEIREEAPAHFGIGFLLGSDPARRPEAVEHFRRALELGLRPEQDAMARRALREWGDG